MTSSLEMIVDRVMYISLSKDSENEDKADIFETSLQTTSSDGI